MNHVERVAIEAISQLPGVPEEARRLLLALTEGRAEREREPGPNPGPGAGPLSPAERMRRYRGRRAVTTVTPSDDALRPVTEAVTRNVTASVTAVAPPDPPENLPVFSDLLPSERGSETRVRAASVTPVTDPVTRNVTASVTRHTNATADGAGGLGVSAWAEGIRSVTKKPFMPPRGGSTELAKLIEALLTFCPDAATRVEWARAEGKRFAETARGKLSAHSFVDWLNSPEADAAKAKPLIEGPAVLEERARRKASHDEASKNAAPPPPELLEVVGLKPRKGAA